MFKRISYTIAVLLALLVLAACGNATPTPTLVLPTATSTAVPTPTLVLPTATPQLEGPYLGQEPPGMEPKIFAPGIVSDPDFMEYSGAFSPDGSEYYFHRVSGNSRPRLLFTKVVDDKWTAPEDLAASAGYGAFEPYVTFDNRRLYFIWEHPVPSGQPSELPAYFFVERTQDGWSKPTYAGQGMFVSSSRDGQLYTTDMSSRETDGKTYLARITVTDGLFTNYERLPIPTRRGSQAHPCIALDESYILFDVESGHHLFVSFKSADGTWGEAIDLTRHGFDPMAGGAYISPDGKYLFFGRGGDIWWVDIRVVENLRPTE
ncbi:MAG: hypothetical protein KKA73_17620 [Chloroflexi bacterium]|nr:hypothetical protein [Chloroflexota bacterium]MBU1749507.1 hypothetical protein [Chloroflexota bacterium]